MEVSHDNDELHLLYPTGITDSRRRTLTYWAHSDPHHLPPEHPEAHWQRLSDHLENVAALAGTLAEAARPNDAQFKRAAQLAGRLHDFGKYSDCFQNMIRTGKGRCQHSAHGALIAYDTKNPDVAFAIAGHHAGMPDPNGGTGTLEVRLKDVRTEATSLQDRACADLPGMASLFQLPHAPRPFNNADFDLHTRMLFSCLVDADRLDSAGRSRESSPLLPEIRLAALTSHLRTLSARSQQETVKQARQKVLNDCLNAASFPERLLSLTVPTGGGKTLAAMAFALERARLFPDLYRRIIVVIPYLSIIEQNAQVYLQVFGPDAVLEHHSGSHDRLTKADDKHFRPSVTGEDRYSPDARQFATEDWDSPLIVTTSVRFFEGLFSNRPSDLRRVHSIARSIVILDEVQTLPRQLLAPLLSMIRELSENWGCTFVFSTATQPAFEKPPGSSGKDARWSPGTIRPIVRDPSRLHASLKRVVIEWELDRKIGWPELAARIHRHSSALCVVNLRDHASTLFDEVLTRSGAGKADGVFHLSTRMCAAHRLITIGQINTRLKNGLACRVISTQLVEAGVDLDFSIAFRALGPLDAVLQVAGRADREGLLTASMGQPAGRVIVFRPEDDRTPPNDYKEAKDITANIASAALAGGQAIQPESVDQMNDYWNRYYGEGQDQGQALQEYRLTMKFATLADEFEMISNRTLDVFVPFDDEARAAIDDLRCIGQLTKDLRRRLQRYVVGLQPYEFEQAKQVLEEIRKDSGIWVAVDRAYTNDKGLKLKLDVNDMIL